MACRRIVTVEDVDLSWMELGADASGARPLVLLHGLSDSNRTWDKIASTLALRRRVLMPDLPGHGRSSRPDATYSIEYYARVLTAWTRAVGLTDFDLVGHSLGGGVAQRMLIELNRASDAHGPAPRVHRLGLIASGGLGREVAWVLRLAAATGAVERIGQPFMQKGTHVGMRLLGGEFREPHRRELGRLNDRAGTARALSRTLGASVGLEGQRLHFMDHAYEVPSLPPMAIFWGERDRVIPVSHAEAVSNFLDGVTVRRFARAGHYPHRESVHELVPALLRFLETEQPRPRIKMKARAKGLRDKLRELLAEALRPSSDAEALRPRSDADSPLLAAVGA